MYTEKEEKDEKEEYYRRELVKNLQNRFKWHTPATDLIGKSHGKIRDTCLEMSYILIDLVPECDERKEAIKKLEEVMMWANAGIARNS